MQGVGIFTEITVHKCTGDIELGLMPVVTTMGWGRYDVLQGHVHQDFDLGWGRRTWGCRWWRTKQTLLPPPDFASSCKILQIAMMNINPCLKLGSREISPPQAFYRGSNCLIGLKCNFISSTSTTWHQVSWPISGLGNRMLGVKNSGFLQLAPNS